MRTILMAMLLGPLLSQAAAPTADDLVPVAEGEVLHAESLAAVRHVGAAARVARDETPR